VLVVRLRVGCGCGIEGVGEVVVSGGGAGGEVEVLALLVSFAGMTERAPSTTHAAGDKAHYLAKVAQKDGTIFGMFASTPLAAWERNEKGLRMIYDSFTLL